MDCPCSGDPVSTLHILPVILLTTGHTPDDGALIMDGSLHPDDLLEQDSTLIEQLGVSLLFLHVLTPYK